MQKNIIALFASTTLAACSAYVFKASGIISEIDASVEIERQTDEFGPKYVLETSITNLSDIEICTWDIDGATFGRELQLFDRSGVEIERAYFLPTPSGREVYDVIRIAPGSTVTAIRTIFNLSAEDFQIANSGAYTIDVLDCNFFYSDDLTSNFVANIRNNNPNSYSTIILIGNIGAR